MKESELAVKFIEYFNEYEIYYRLNEDYIWCICWNEYLDKKETYMSWYIEMPISEIQALF